MEVAASVIQIETGDSGRSPLRWNSIAFMGTPQPAVGESSVLACLDQSQSVTWAIDHGDKEYH